MAWVDDEDEDRLDESLVDVGSFPPSPQPSGIPGGGMPGGGITGGGAPPGEMKGTTSVRIFKIRR